MSSNNYEESDDGHDLDVLTILYYCMNRVFDFLGEVG